MRYRVVRCYNCSTYQTTSAIKTFKCIKCSKTKVISVMKKYFQSNEPNSCTIFIQNIKVQFAKNNNKYSEEFKSVI